MERALVWLAHGGSVAVVVAGETHKLSEAKSVASQLVALGWKGYDAIDGDKSDVRFDDPGGSWVVLYAKGHKALRDVSGFVRRFAVAS